MVHETHRDKSTGSSATVLDVTGHPSSAQTVRDQWVAETVHDNISAANRDQEPHGYQRVNLPPTLAARFHIVEHLPTQGSEADILLVKSNVNEEKFVIKLYRQGIQPKSEVLNKISQAAPEHVIRIFEYEKSDGVWYERLEYAPHGSLRNIFDTGALAHGKIRKVLEELVQAIAHIHEIDIVHRDLKPENILIRCREPLDLVLTDFGISSDKGGISQHFSKNANRTVSYAAPEASSGTVEKPTDYWPLGIMLVEMLTGTHPFKGMDDQRIEYRMRTQSRPVDLSGIEEPWLYLCRGLLLRDPKNRWGEPQIRQWFDPQIDNAAIPIVEDYITQDAAPAVTPFHIKGRDCKTLEELAQGLAENWTTALERIGRYDVTNWVRDNLRDSQGARIIQEIMDNDNLNADHRLFLIITKFAPNLPPYWKGYALTPATLFDFSKKAGGNVEIQNLIRDVFDKKLLSLYGEAANKPAEKKFHDRWQTQATLYEQTRQRISKGGGPDTFDLAHAHSDLLLALIDTTFLNAIQSRLKKSIANGVMECPWFSDISTSITNEPALLVLQDKLLDAGLDYVVKERKRLAEEKAEQKKLATWRTQRAWLLLFGSMAHGIMFGVLFAGIRYWTGGAGPVPRAWDISYNVKEGVFGGVYAGIMIFSICAMVAYVWIMRSFYIELSNKLKNSNMG